jgi:hypothetical protein
MSTRKGLALAAFLAVGAVALSPLASRAQFLAGQAAAAGIQGDLAGRAGANGLSAADRARAQLAAANDRGRAADEFSEEAAAPTGGSELARAMKSPASLKKLVGREIEIMGEVRQTVPNNGEWLAAITPSPEMGLAPEVLFFLMVPKDIEAGRLIRTRAVLISGKSGQTGIYGLLFDSPSNLKAQPGRAPIAPAPAADAAPAGPQGFANGLPGWRLAGVVDMEKGTCLFLDSQGQPKFLQPGQELEAGVFLKEVEGQDVTLQVEGKDLLINVW